MSVLKPEKYFRRVSDVDISADLLDKGIRAVLLDIDNTIRSRETHLVPEDVAAWMTEAQQRGLKLCLLSNNWHANAYELGKELGVPVVAKACKPLPFGYIAALAKLGAKARETVLIGDILFTDVLGANLAGLRGYLVEPLATKDLSHTLALREVQKVILGDLQPQGAAGSPAAEVPVEDDAPATDLQPENEVSPSDSQLQDEGSCSNPRAQERDRA
ncbi:MAG: YqeG family HAD IIIA-type phosphatase [Eggerthellales bacterium]|nr:YqeG family HAD IIIA-type phosphatase [Eggerthellales bacterium]